jgi:glycosyltransferase involved in cell wall biosynthesis
VAITGWVPDPYPYLEHADVFALPSLQEGSGSVSLIEALQAGVSIVASKVDGIPEDVEDGDSAVLVEPADADALHRALARVIGDGDLRRRLARRARETFLQRFSVDVFTEALHRTYAALLGQPVAIPP